MRSIITSSIVASALLAASSISAFAGTVSVGVNDFFGPANKIKQLYYNGQPAEVSAGVAKDELCAVSPVLTKAGAKQDCHKFGSVKFAACPGKYDMRKDGYSDSWHGIACVKFTSTEAGNVSFVVKATGHAYTVTNGLVLVRN